MEFPSILRSCVMIPYTLANSVNQAGLFSYNIMFVILRKLRKSGRIWMKIVSLVEI